MADLPIRGLLTLTFLSDPLEPIFESESLVFVERCFQLGDEAFALNPQRL